MQLKDALGRFFIEFYKFETTGIGRALRSLSRDPVFAEQAEKLLDLDARLTLIERMAYARALQPPLAIEVERLLTQARKLHSIRDELSFHLDELDLDDVALPPALTDWSSPVRRTGAYGARPEPTVFWMPDAARLDSYTDAVKMLHEELLSVIAKVDAPALPGDPVS